MNLGEFPEALSVHALADKWVQCSGHPPLVISPPDDRPIKRVAWCTGAAQGYFEAATSLGIDAYISGEVSEQTFHIAQEMGVHYFAAGHHATERYGVQAIGEHISREFQLGHLYIDIPNPV